MSIKSQENQRNDQDLFQQIPVTNLFQAILDGPRAIIITDIKGNIVYINPRFTKDTGYTFNEVAGKNPRILKSGVNPPRIYQQLWETIIKGKVWEAELHNRKKSGEHYWVFTSISPVKNNEGAITHFLSVQKDITERKRRETRYEEFVNDTADALIAINEHGIVEFFNPAAEKMFGYSKDEIIEQNVKMLMPESYRDKHEAGLNNYVSTGKSAIIGLEPVELEALHKNGTTFPVELTIGDARLDEHRTFIGIIRDISERKWAEKKLLKSMEELECSNKELEQFAYVASHDLQEPLRMITSYTKLLERRYKDKLDENANDFIAYAVDGATRMQGLINSLLAFSRVSTRGKEFGPTDCCLVLNQAIANLKMFIEENSASIKYDPLPTVMGDGSQLVLLFQNLIGNAIKFRGENTPQVHISAQRNEEEWVFCVSDNGIGIDPEYFNRIFVIFQRLHGKDTYPGFGIGLSISKKIVERHHGRIWVESEGGKGTRFYFTIPIKQ